MNANKAVCHIVAAADFDPRYFAPRKGDFIIAADAGLLHLKKLKISPDLVLGDFDSVGFVPTEGRVERIPVKKDFTDSHYALMRAKELGFDAAVLYGCTGGKRFDHSLANLEALLWAEENGLRAFMIGAGFCMSAIKGASLSFPAKKLETLSLFPFCGTVENVSAKNCLYELENAQLSPTETLAVSNSSEGSAVISSPDGAILVYWDFHPGDELPKYKRF